MRKKTVKKQLKCLKCGDIATIHRKVNRNKKAGHLKGLYCVTCGKKTKHEELSRFWNEGG